MNIDYTVTALMFPAIPLLMSVYANRFHTLSALIRKIHDEYVWEKHIPQEWEKQLINLNGRVKWLRYTLAFASFGFLFNMLTVFALYLNVTFVARIIFGSCCLVMIISVIFFIRDIHLSTAAYADNIIVLDKGSIIEQGSHNYLLDLKGKYFEMWEKQKA